MCRGDMKPLTRQKKAVYEYLKVHGPATIREIRDATRAMKCDMRISEINYAYRQEHGKDLIVNVGKNKYNEVIKGIAETIKKYVYKPRFNPDGTVTMIQEAVDV